jgi:hypothetical protein
MKKLKILLIVLAVFVLALCFAACDVKDGDGDGDQGTSAVRTKVAKPTLTQRSFEYSGSAATVTLSATDETYTVSGDITKTDVGSYTAKVTLNDTTNYEWTDGTTAPLNLTWEIYTANLAFTPIDGGAAYEVSKGTANTNGPVFIPSTYNGKPVTTVGEFANCSDLTGVSIPSSVTFIGGNAFYDCQSLTSITIPSSVTSIGETA